MRAGLGGSVWPTQAAEPLRLDDVENAALGSLEYRGGLVLDGFHDDLGGVSGMLVSADGASAVLVSDEGRWFDLALVHDEAGWLVDAALRRQGPLIDENGRLPRSKRATIRKISPCGPMAR